MTPRTDPVGFIGLGTMGLPMALNISKAGFLVLGYVRRVSSKVNALIQSRLSTISEPGDLRSVRALILMLPDASAIGDVLFGPRGIASSLEPETLVINASTISPEQSRELGAQLAACGLHYLEAPVTGSRPQAEAGTLNFLVGGPEDLVKRASPLLESMGSRIQWLGETGAASAAKLAANLIGAVNLLAWCEGLHLSERYGVGRSDFLNVVVHSGARSTIAEAKGPNTVTRDYPLTFRLELMAKDLHLADYCAEGSLAIISAALKAYRSAVKEIGPNHDVSAVNEVYE